MKMYDWLIFNIFLVVDWLTFNIILFLS